MLKLHGFAVSNYYNMVKLALLEKELDFELVKTYPGQQSEHLQRHPIGKVPALETEHGFLAETSVILDYLEQAYPHATPLLPTAPFEQGRVKELMQIIQLYLELPARRCFAEAFFGGKVDQAIKDSAKIELENGIKALKRRAKFQPYIAGETFTLADIVFIFTIDLACTVARKIFHFDLLQDFQQARDLIELLSQRPFIKQIRAERDLELAAFIEARTKANQ